MREKGWRDGPCWFFLNKEGSAEPSDTILILGEGTGDEAMIGVGVGKRILGILKGRRLRKFLWTLGEKLSGGGGGGGFVVVGRLFDVYAELGPWRSSGGTLWCYGNDNGLEVKVKLRKHCYGVAGGPVVIRLFNLAMARALKGMKADTRPAEVLTEADRELLRGMGIGSE